MILSLGSVGLMFYTGGIEQVRESQARRIELIGGVPGKTKFMPKESRGKVPPGSPIYNENNVRLGCLGADLMTIEDKNCE